MRTPTLRDLAGALAAGLLLVACGGAAPGTPGGGGGGGGGSGASGPLFTAPNAWNTAVDGAPLHAASASMLSWLAGAGGFGGGRMQVDFSIKVLEATAATPFLDFTPGSSFYSPDCDRFPFPVPAGGAVEGEAGYACTSGGDCHLLVVDRAHARLYEMYQADLRGTAFSGGCAVRWDLGRTYPADLRGDQCTSTDAAGLPVAALLFTADELAAGSVDHAIRFILPNARMRARAYVRPATHAGAPSGPAEAPPYGSRLRLRADYPVASLASPGARVVARALQRYGMILADGGTIALTAADDAFTAHKYAETGFEARSLDALQPTDFEVVDTGPVIVLTYDCVRNGL
jgi:serine/threonine-protein kinase